MGHRELASLLALKLSLVLLAAFKRSFQHKHHGIHTSLSTSVPAAIAIYKEAHFPLALSIFLAQTAWSALKAVDALTKRVKD